MPKTDWLVRILGAVVLFSTVSFGVYYYFDRYGHADQAVVPRQIQNVEAMVRDNPQNPDLRVAAANYYFDNGLVDQAIQQSQQALTIDPNDQGALILLGEAYQKKGSFDSAIDALKKVIDLNKNNPLAKIDPRLEMVHYELGTMHSRQGDYANAITSLKSALVVNNTDSDAHYALGVVYQKQNDNANAAQEFKEAVRFTPDYLEAYEGLAASETALGKPSEAKYARGMVLLLQGDSASAAAQMQELVSQSPDMKAAYYGLGLADEKLGKRDQAIQALREYLKTNASDIAAQQALGRLTRGN